MKKVFQTIISLTLLMASALGVYAQGSIEGTVTATMRYSLKDDESRIIRKMETIFGSSLAPACSCCCYLCWS